MMGRKIITYGVIILMIAYVAYRYLSQEPEFTVSETGIENAKEEDKEKINIKEALVESFESKKELITSEAELSQVAGWDESWGNIGLFHKSQNVKFHGTGLYTTDLAHVTEEDITVNESGKTVTVKIPSPQVKTVTIDETKTEYEDVDKGWLRFGDIKLKQEQYSLMYNSVKESMTKQLESDDMMSKAKESSKQSVKEMFEEMLKSIDEGYSVKVEIK